MGKANDTDRQTKRGHEASGTEPEGEPGQVSEPDEGGDTAQVALDDSDMPAIDDVLDAIDAAVMPDEDAPSGQQNETRSETVPYGAAQVKQVVEEGAPARSASATGSGGQSTPLAPEEAVSLLARVNIFADLPPPFLKRIAAICEEERHEYGQKVFKEGDPGDRLYLIHTGAVRISRDVPGMGEEALAVLKAGDYFGEMALIDDFPRSADAVAHEDCRLVVIGKDKLADLLFVDRDLAYDLLWTFVRTLSSRLRQTNDKMTFMAVTSKF